jgi:hypothetical protein
MHFIYVNCVNNNVACVVSRRRDIPVRLAMPHATHSPAALPFPILCHVMASLDSCRCGAIRMFTSHTATSPCHIGPIVRHKS